jgi:hypothetical protein
MMAMLRWLALLVIVLAWLYSGQPTLAQEAPTSGARTWTAHGLLYASSRSFQTIEERDGTFYWNFEVFEFDAALRAENAIDPLVDVTLEYMDSLESAARPILPTVPPTVGNSTLAYEG